MRLHYLLDTHAGSYNRPIPTRDEVSAFIDQLYREIELAEEGGFDSIVVPERHGRTECFFPSSLVLLSVIAARTSRIRLGSYILVLPLHHPIHVAEQVAMIDQVSRGRVIFGVAAGYHSGYSRMFGIPHHGRGARFEEQVEIIKLAWTEERFSYHGRYYQFDDVMLTPKPYQKPMPEWWVGGMFPKTIARAGRIGDAWCSDPFPLDQRVWLEQVHLYREAARAAGRSSKVVLMRDGWVAPTREEAEEVFGRLAVEEWLFYFRWGILTHHPEFQSESDFTIERASRHFILGSPAECIRQIEMYAREYDVDEIVLRFRLPKGPRWDQVLQCLALFGREVVPYFHSQNV